MLLAAGRASRMGENAGHKLLAEFDGEALVRRMALNGARPRMRSVPWW
jgi:molybdenum cofactor cytidylyltransferase